MRKIASAAVAAAAQFGAAHAQAIFSEFTVGAGFPTNVSTVNYDVVVPFDISVPVDPPPATIDLVAGDELAGTLSGKYKAGITGGLEVGMRGVGDKHVSLTVSYDYLQANLHKITANGTLNGAPLNATSSLSTLGATGADFNNEAHLILGNVRYEFVGPREKIQPFLSVGGGITSIEDSSASPAIAGTAGFRVPLGLGFYAGARYRYVRSFGYEDELGIDYEDLSAHLISFMLGAQM